MFEVGIIWYNQGGCLFKKIVLKRYMGWPKKNAMILIRNFNDVIDWMPLIFAVLDRIFFSK